jgi:hypothetical protein
MKATKREKTGWIRIYLYLGHNGFPWDTEPMLSDEEEEEVVE